MDRTPRKIFELVSGLLNDICIYVFVCMCIRKSVYLLIDFIIYSCISASMPNNWPWCTCWPPRRSLPHSTRGQLHRRPTYEQIVAWTPRVCWCFCIDTQSAHQVCCERFVDIGIDNWSLRAGKSVEVDSFSWIGIAENISGLNRIYFHVYIYINFQHHKHNLFVMFFKN